MNDVLGMLGGGDLRSEGRAAEVAELVIADPDRLVELAEGLARDDRLVRARTCMAIEVISRTHPELLKPVVTKMIGTAERETVAQARWHLAETFCNVPLDRRQVERVVPVLLEYLEDRSKIVRYCAVQALGVLGSRSARKSEIVAAIRPRADEGKSMAKRVARALELLGD
jgi:HEAT repeat protein